MRQLKCLNFKVPDMVDREMKVADKFYHHGVMLQQVANFYNTIATQMLPCHKPCLLEHAKVRALSTNPPLGCIDPGLH